jgi:hypothetical protein
LARNLNLLVFVVSVFFFGAAHATFIDLGGGVVLDSTTGLEWEQNANHGDFSWAGAVAYANDLTLDGGGWRLPAIGELAQLYGDLNAEIGCTDCTGDQGPFTGIQSMYWSATSTGVVAWVYIFSDGGQIDKFLDDRDVFAWAVRGTPIPEPTTLVLLSLGVAGLAATKRRKLS